MTITSSSDGFRTSTPVESLRDLRSIIMFALFTNQPVEVVMTGDNGLRIARLEVAAGARTNILSFMRRE